MPAPAAEPVAVGLTREERRPVPLGEPEKSGKKGWPEGERGPAPVAAPGFVKSVGEASLSSSDAEPVWEGEPLLDWERLSDSEPLSESESSPDFGPFPPACESSLGGFEP